MMSTFPTATAETIALTDFQNLIINLKSNPFNNLLANGSFERTTHGDLQSDYWQESGVVNARSNTQKKFGDYSCKISPSATSDHSYQDIINYVEFKGLSVAFGCWIYAPDTNVILRISDGVGSTDSSTNSSTSAWEYLYLARTIDDSATRIRAELRPTDTAGDFFFDGAILVPGTEPPRTAPSLSLGELVRRLWISATEPTWYAEIGDEYFNTTEFQKYMYDGTDWRLVS